MSHATLHAMAGRTTGDLELTLQPVVDHGSARLAAVLTAAMQRDGRWRAVKTLRIKDLHRGHMFTSLFAHLIGPACPSLQSLKLRCEPANSDFPHRRGYLEPTVFSGLSACPRLTHLTVTNLELTLAAVHQVQLLAIHAPGLTSLTVKVSGADPQAPLVSAAAPRLKTLVWCSIAYSPACATALARCQQLVSVELGGVQGSELLNTLAQLPALRHVKLAGFMATGPVDALAQPRCTWETLTVTTPVYICDVPSLLLRGLGQLHLRGLRFGQLGADQDMGALRTTVDRAVAALLPLARRGALAWIARHGQPQLDVHGLAQWAPMFASVAQLAPYLGPTQLHAFSLPPDEAVSGALLTGLCRDLATMQLSLLHLSSTSTDSSFWAALRNLPPGTQTLQLGSCQAIDEADLVLWLVTHPHPLKLMVFHPSAQAAAAVHGAHQRVVQQGLRSQVRVVVMMR